MPTSCQDLLIDLKMMVIRRANLIDGDSLVEKFDLKILRALGMLFIPSGEMRWTFRMDSSKKNLFLFKKLKIIPSKN